MVCPSAKRENTMAKVGLREWLAIGGVIASGRLARYGGPGEGPLDRFEKATTVSVTRVERSWAGLRSFAPDRTPVAGFSDRAEGFLWLAGQGGYGIQTSPALSRLAADLILGRAPALAPAVVAALDPGRFNA